jgi:acyl-CoA hydrolase
MDGIVPRAPSISRRRVALGALIGALLCVAACSRRRAHHERVAQGATVLALGDSITHGTGADAVASYPSVLASLSGWNVVNGGVPGDTSAQALERLPSLLAEHRPALVLVSIGGNDLLRRLPEDDLRRNLERMLDAVKAAGAQAVLIAIPRPTLSAGLTGSLSDHPLYAKLAEQHAVPLVADAWSSVLADARLRSDQIHANAAGYRAFAQALLRRLTELGIAG